MKTAGAIHAELVVPLTIRRRRKEIRDRRYGSPLLPSLRLQLPGFDLDGVLILPAALSTHSTETKENARGR